jgi:hypothetical protein
MSRVYTVPAGTGAVLIACQGAAATMAFSEAALATADVWPLADGDKESFQTRSVENETFWFKGTSSSLTITIMSLGKLLN